MITEGQYVKDNVYFGAVKLFGLHTDSKPTCYGNGSIFTEIDTGKNFIFNASSGSWVEQGVTYEYISGDITESPQTIGSLPEGDWVCSVLYPMNLDITVATDESNNVIVTSEDYTGAVVVLCFKV